MAVQEQWLDMTENIFAQHGRKTNHNSDIILLYIQKNPGSHLRGIHKGLEMPLGTLRYHLGTLEKTGQIISERYNSHRHYFIAGFFKENERSMLKMLNKKNLKQIISFLMGKDNPVTLPDIATHTGMSHASVMWHIKELVNLGMALESNGGKYKKYRLVESQDVIHLLKIYVYEN